MAKNKYYYIATFNYANDGISISFQDLPGCLSCAYNEAEAFKNAKEALALYLYDIDKDNAAYPKPSSLENIVLDKGDIPAYIEINMQKYRRKIIKP